ncbi:MAG: transglycosylase domain-containing protein [Candidatus Saccharibacteria bacterium]|nr:transglycosylase domain-containing protein [Candidatus Saccharibacteria bacterium]
MPKRKPSSKSLSKDSKKPQSQSSKLSKIASFLNKIKVWILIIVRFLKRIWNNQNNEQKPKIEKKNLDSPKKNKVKSNQPLNRFHPKRVIKYIFSLKGLFLFVKLGFLGLILISASFIGLYLHYRQDVPVSIANLNSCIDGQTTKYYDQTGQTLLWSSKSDVDCQPIEISQVSPHLIDALIIIEDRNFYEHRGFQATAIIRAVLNNVFNDNQGVQGGSTITQQYIKNAILKDSRRNLDRKIKEVIIALELERTFEKDEILTAYLNTISFGSIYSGVEAAAQGYFQKPAKNLSLDEATLLVAALPAPTTYWNNPQLHRQRQLLILSEMLQAGVISQAQYDRAKSIDSLANVTRSHKQYENIIAPHFVLEAEKRLTEELCQEQRQETGDQDLPCDNIRLKGYKVITTLNMETQKIIEDTIEAVVPTIIHRGFDNAAGVAVDVQTGKVIGQVGSRDFNYEGFGQVNTVTQQRDPGSTFKLFDYAALIENTDSWGPGSIFYDYKTTFNDQGWTPANYNNKHAGPITMRQALGQSLNIPAVKAMYIAGIDTVHDLAYQAGIRTKLPCSETYCGLATAFGGGAEVRLDELTNAYATFSRNGNYLPLTYIDRVENADGRLIKQWRQRPQRVIKHQTAYLLNHMLADSSARYTQAFNLDSSVNTVMAMKTGTDDHFVNNHIVGYSQAVAFGGWIGHHDEAVLFETERHTVQPKALMIKTFMENYHRQFPAAKRDHWLQPQGIKSIKIDLITGYQVGGSENLNLNSSNIRYLISEGQHPRPVKTDIFPSWYVPKVSLQENQQQLTVDIVTGKIATACTPPLALRQGLAVNILNEISFDDPFYESWQKPILEGLLQQKNIIGYSAVYDDLHQCNDPKPQITLLNSSCSNICLIEVRLIAGKFALDKLTVRSGHQIIENGEITLSDEDQQIISFEYNPFQNQINPVSRGLLELEVIDKAYYHQTLDVNLNIVNFPVTSPEDDQSLYLRQAEISADGRSLILAWNRLVDDLSLYFEGNCQNIEPRQIIHRTTQLVIDISQYPSGQCQIYLSNGQQVSNSLIIQLD